MEETKDIRELKSLLSGLSSNDDARHFPVSTEAKAADTCAQKIALLKSLSVLLCSLSLFLFLALLFVLARHYLTPPANNHTGQTHARPVVRHEVPAVTEPARVAAGRPEIAAASNNHTGQAEAIPVAPDAVPVAAESARARSEQPGPASPAVPQPDRTPPAAAGERGDTRSVVLKEAGGSLYFIALQQYGKADETIFDLILQANPSIVDVRKIDDRQKIVVPHITAESYITGSAQDGYRIHVGTYETAEWADIYGARVKSAAKRVFVEPQQFSSHDTWYRLLIGGFNSREEARQTVSALVKRGLIYLPPPPG
jgi:hypothetical protein